MIAKLELHDFLSVFEHFFGDAFADLIEQEQQQEASV